MSWARNGITGFAFVVNNVRELRLFALSVRIFDSLDEITIKLLQCPRVLFGYDAIDSKHCLIDVLT